MLPVCGIVFALVHMPGAAGELRCARTRARSLVAVAFVSYSARSIRRLLLTGVRTADCDTQHANAPARPASTTTAARGFTVKTYPGARTAGARSSAIPLSCVRTAMPARCVDACSDFHRARAHAHHAVHRARQAGHLGRVPGRATATPLLIRHALAQCAPSHGSLRVRTRMASTMLAVKVEPAVP